MHQRAFFGHLGVGGGGQIILFESGPSTIVFGQNFPRGKVNNVGGRHYLPGLSNLLFLLPNTSNIWSVAVCATTLIFNFQGEGILEGVEAQTLRGLGPQPRT